MDGKKCVVLYLGDHDPSGIDMTRDIQARLDMFVDDGSDGEPVLRAVKLLVGPALDLSLKR